jgi:hypothetical protein
MGLLENLTGALLDYLAHVEEAEAFCPVAPAACCAEESDYSGMGFVWAQAGHYGRFGGRKYVALMSDIGRLFVRVQRYTAQKSRFIVVRGESGGDAGSTNTDLYSFTVDEVDLYRQFLREASHRLWQLFSAYGKGFPYRGFLFDEGVSIVELTESEVAERAWAAGSFVRVSGVLYRSVEAVPSGTALSDVAYWSPASGLYDTLGKVVYFVSFSDSGDEQLLLVVLKAVQDYLYSFVLWRWYVLAGLSPEAEVWRSSYEQAGGTVRSFLDRFEGPVRRGMQPF